MMENPGNMLAERQTSGCFSILSKGLAQMSISMIKSPKQILEDIASVVQLNIFTKEFAVEMDSRDILAATRKKFDYPLKKYLTTADKDTNYTAEEECLYLCGNSLGLKPKRTNELVNEQLIKWGKIGVEMHFDNPVPAALCDLYGRESLGRLVGADPSCVCLMNGLSVNLHLLLVSFYQPRKEKFKILIESKAFPSDRYAVQSHAAVRGYDPKEAIIELVPREDEILLRTEDILQVIENEGSSIAVICLSGVQYYTGQKFDMEKITKAGQEKGCIVGWDLAHAIGNVALEMDNWGVDFACWCTYKYLNSGPGCIAGAYVNKKHKTRQAPHFLGWWSSTEKTRFNMLEECEVAEGVDGFKITNPSPIMVSCVLAGLEAFDDWGMDKLLAKQYLLTGYLELLLEKTVLQDGNYTQARIITPRDPLQRGSQLSVQFDFDLGKIHEMLKKKGILVDIRRPNTMRISPVPLYNSFQDVYSFVRVLHQIIVAHGPVYLGKKMNGHK